MLFRLKNIFEKRPPKRVRDRTETAEDYTFILVEGSNIPDDLS